MRPPTSSSLRSLARLTLVFGLLLGAVPCFAEEVDEVTPAPDAGRLVGQARADLDGRRFLEAERGLREALKLDPTHADARVLLAAVLIEQSRDDEAQRLLKEELKASPDNMEAIFHQARLYLYRGDHERAGEGFRQIVARDPENAAAHYYLGEIHWARYEDEQAEAAYREALRIAPSFQKPWYTLAFLYYKQKKYPEAEAAAKKGLEIESEDYRCHNLLGLVAYETYRDDDAERAYRQAVRSNPGFAFGWFNLGMLFYSQEKWALAKEHFEKAATLFDPEREPANAEKARAYADKADALSKGRAVEKAADPIKKSQGTPVRPRPDRANGNRAR